MAEFSLTINAALVPEVRAEFIRLQLQVGLLRTVADEATTAIDEVESEPGRPGPGSIFKIDWQRALKALRAAAGDGIEVHALAFDTTRGIVSPCGAPDVIGTTVEDLVTCPRCRRG